MKVIQRCSFQSCWLCGTGASSGAEIFGPVSSRLAITTLSPSSSAVIHLANCARASERRIACSLSYSQGIVEVGRFIDRLLINQSELTHEKFLGNFLEGHQRSQI